MKSVSLALSVVLLGAGLALAARRYDQGTADRLLPGVTISGLEVGEMRRADAIEAVEDRAQALLRREIEVRAGEDTWNVAPSELGTRAVVEPVVDRALTVNEGYSWPDRVFRRVFNRPTGHAFDLRFRHDAGRLGRFIENVAMVVQADPFNAKVDYVGDRLVLRKPEPGWELPVEEARRELRRALASGAPSVDLDLNRIPPDVTRQDLGYTIVVDLSDRQLHLFDGLKLQKTYPVAVGQPSFPTPTGEWEIINKRINPTWTNPSPDGWGASLPAFIPPGPGNPLGTRALDLDAPGIRIHGTYASYSIGTYASHGCVRMFLDDVEELFDIVPIGTEVEIVP
ncbi:MAG TPA: L,D-transpeptidase/peptidoglycan binding protein [Actinomycetota bacterium]|nr:L,D-transpeptidase/peptidoglycan binding protein [Actinomycetota bacterium]